MREAGGAAGDVRTAGSVERLEDEEPREGQQAMREGMVQPAAVQQRKKPEWLRSPEDRRMEEGGRPRAGGVAVGVEGVITTALRRWKETVSVREPRRRVKK